MAYTSNEGGQPNVYVQPFPGPGARTTMAVPIGAGRSFAAGLPQALFLARALLGPNQAYAVTKDGRRFLVNARPQQSSGAAPLTVVLNWTAAI